MSEGSTANQMTRLLIALLLTPLLLLLCSKAESNELVIRIVGPQSEQDTSHRYFEQLFIKALQHGSEPQTTVSIQRIPFAEHIHGGESRLLDSKVIDVFWSATDKQIESRLLPVRIPLVMGLLGYRVAITHRDNVSKFTSLQDLKRHKACQVRHWTDVKILEHNQFTIVPTDSFERTFELTDKGRCDYFPRAIYEGYQEQKAAQERFPELTIFDDILLYYPFPLYAFTSKDNVPLNRKLTLGLTRMVKSGELLQHIKASESTRHLFPLSRWQDKRIRRLENPFLPEETPLDDPDLWMQLGKDIY